MDDVHATLTLHLLCVPVVLYNLLNNSKSLIKQDPSAGFISKIIQFRGVQERSHAHIIPV